MERYPMLMIARIINVKMTALVKAIHRFNTITIKIFT